MPRDREKYRAWVKNYDRNIRLEVLAHYGNLCACCGETTEEFLTIDHINGGGSAHRKSIKRTGSSFYRWLKFHEYPQGYRTLCYNCNISLGRRGYCPHGNLK